MDQFSDILVKQYNILSIDSKSVDLFMECIKVIKHLSLDNILSFDIMNKSQNNLKLKFCRIIKHPTLVSNILVNLINMNEKRLIKTIRKKNNANQQNTCLEEVLIEKGYVEYKWNNSRILTDLMKSNGYYYIIYHPAKIKYKIDSKIEQVIQFNKNVFSSTSCILYIYNDYYNMILLVKNQYCDYDIEYLSDFMMRMSFLEEICIFSDYTTDKSLYYLCNSFKYISNLKKFWVDMKNLTDEGISYFCDNVGYITELISLSLFSNKITEDGCDNIINHFRCLTNLQKLAIVTKQIPLQNDINQRARDKHPNKSIHLYIHTVREDI